MRTSRELHYGWVSWFVLVHILGIIGTVYAIVGAETGTIVFAIVFYFLCHLSISCGAHRLYSHVSYKASPALQYFLLLFFSAVGQGPMQWWKGKHVAHHAATDTVADPHSPLFGFFWAHMGWMCTKEGIAPADVRYMRSGKDERGYLRWQYQYHWPLSILMGLIIPVVFCGFFFHDWAGGFLVAVAARLVFQYHFTWVVNSVCHVFGQEVHGCGSSRNIPMLGLLTVGESYHANHHVDDTSWKLGHGRFDFDPGKWFIALCIALGLASPRASRKLT